MRIDCARIGRWICLACDYQHDEDPEDESTWLEQWRHAPARETA